MSISVPVPVEGSIHVDLDREILRTDLALEMVIAALKTRPVGALVALLYLLLGARTRALRFLESLEFDAACGLYDAPRVRELVRNCEEGGSLLVASGLPPAWVEAIRLHLGLTWAMAIGVPGQSPVTAPPRISARKARLPLRALVKLMRLHQWSKNLLVFAPLALAFRLEDLAALRNCALAFLCFGLVASSIYILNDMMDVAQDRRHPSKCRRPFASGALPVRAGFLLAPLLVACAVVTALPLPAPFWCALAAYVALNLAYVFFLKRKLLVDVLALAGGYTLRILAGNAAGPVELSSWLLAFSMFLFLSLALIKRYVELDTTEIDKDMSHKVMGRGYRRSDLDMLSQLGVSSAFSAVLVLALYVDNAGRQGLYSLPQLIWLSCPIVLFVIARLWVLAKRRELPDDPVLFMLYDWRSHLMGGVVAAILMLAR